MGKLPTPPWGLVQLSLTSFFFSKSNTCIHSWLSNGKTS
jgi:hypothetical protein